MANDKNEFRGLKFKLFGVPEHYSVVEFSDVEIAAPEQNRLKTAFSNLPQGVTVFVQGTAGPIVNLLDKDGKAVKGINFAKRLADPFEQKESFINPKGDVILLYNVEKSMGNIAIAQTLLTNILNHYKVAGSTVLVESSLTARAFSDVYAVSFVNKTVMKPKKEEKFI